MTPPPDNAPVILWAHEECFATQRDTAVEPDDPQDHGHIPGDARCAFCGDTLPIVGRHPYVFDVGTFSPPHRFWAHAPCLLERLVSGSAEQLDATRRDARAGGEPA